MSQSFSSSCCSLATVANSNSGIEADRSMTSDKEKVWERPWSITELRDGSRNWTLASDAGVSRGREGREREEGKEEEGGVRGKGEGVKG